MKNFLILTTLLISLSSCSLLSRSKPLEYYSLNKVKNSCFKSVSLNAPNYQLAEKMIVRRGPHAVANVPAAYWIRPLSTQLGEVLTSEQGQHNLSTRIQDLYFSVDKQQLVLNANYKKCLKNSCRSSKIRLSKEVKNIAAHDIVAAYQAIFEDFAAEICTASSIKLKAQKAIE